MAITPTTPPSGADFSALVKKVNELATKAGIAPLSDTVTGRIPLWKRWVGGEGPEFNEAAERGLKTAVSANADQLNRVKADLDDSKENNGVAHASFDQRLKLLEAERTHAPFPASG